MCRTIFVPSRLAVWVWRRPADSHHFVQLTSFFTAHFCTLHTLLLLCISRQTPQLQKRDWTRKTLNSVKRGPRVCQLSVSEELRSGRYYQILSNIFDTIRYYPILSDIIQYYPILSDIFRYHPVLSDIIRYYPIFSDIFRYHPVLSDIIWHYLISSSDQELFCNYLQSTDQKDVAAADVQYTLCSTPMIITTWPASFRVWTHNCWPQNFTGGGNRKPIYCVMIPGDKVGT